jgi:hypothetical protein
MIPSFLLLAQLCTHYALSTCMHWYNAGTSLVETTAMQLLQPIDNDHIVASGRASTLVVLRE